MRVWGLTQHASHSENLPDTNIVCNHVKGVASFAVRDGRLVVKQGKTTAGCTNVVAQYKLLFGLAARPSAWLQATYDQKMTKLQVLQPSPDAGEHHARISTHLKAVGQPIGANKALTAAHALTVDATLVYEKKLNFCTCRARGLKICWPRLILCLNHSQAQCRIAQPAPERIAKKGAIPKTFCKA